MNQLRQTIDRAAKTNSRIMIVGPSGSGKELAARTLHQLSSRADGPFVVINAAAITPDRMEIELFGVGIREWRAGAQDRRAGRSSRRHAVRRRNRRHAARDPEQDPARAGGSDLPARRRHQQGRTWMCASCRRRRATSKPKSPLASFREDLYHRLSVVPICVRRCRSGEDIPELVGFFMDQISQSTGLPRRRSARTPWPCCNRMSGRATSASFATTSSG